MSDYYVDSSAPVPTFITSDTDLLTAAEAENLPSDSPFQHPERNPQAKPDTP